MRFAKPLVLVALLFTGAALASEPPAYLPPLEPPVARVAAETEASADPRTACVTVQWKQYLGSGTCIYSEGGKSLVLTCNHIYNEASDGSTAAYPLDGAVTHKGTRYTATAVAGDGAADLALVIVDGTLPVARLAVTAAAPGDKIVHYGNASGTGPSGSRGTVVSPWPNYVNPSCHFEYAGLAIEGDSGAGVFNTSGELVAVVCGRTGFSRTNNGRGTPVTAIRVTVTQKAPFRLFPRFRTWLDSRRGASAAPMGRIEPPAAVTIHISPDGTVNELHADGVFRAVPGAAKRSPAVAEPPACEGGRCPIPQSQPQAQPFQFGSSCPGGNCPAPQRRGLFR